jgi:DNA-binding CsgD family transcriptional regulator
MSDDWLKSLVGSPDQPYERPDRIGFLKVAKSVFPLTTASYLGLNIPHGAERKHFVHCMYSEQGFKHCVSRQPLDMGLLSGLSLALPTPIDWSVMPETEGTQKLLAYAVGEKCGRQVLSIPLRPVGRETAIFFLGAELVAGDWQARKRTLLRECQVLARYLHQHILRIYAKDAESQALVSARELDCLKWVAAGKTAWEASVILGISERTVRFHLNAAREKLNCLTTTQAVAKAVSSQLLSPEDALPETNLPPE